MKTKILPIVDSVIEKLCIDRNLLEILLRAFGSPLNIIFPQIISKNVLNLHNLFEPYNIPYKIYFSCKPNRSKGIKRQIASLHKNTYVDVSSKGELESALICGFQAQRIQATGPKNFEYLLLAYQHQILINVDNWAELEILKNIYMNDQEPHPVKIMCRLDVILEKECQDSTFGFPYDDIQSLLYYLRKSNDIFIFEGFSFHLNVQDKDRKLELISLCLQATTIAREQGFNPNNLNIGGGFRIQYSENIEEWKAWEENVQNEVLNGKIVSGFSGHGFGFMSNDNKVVGKKNYTDHARPKTPIEDIQDLLLSKIPTYNISFNELLKQFKLILIIEPGLSVYDQAGITASLVCYNKKSIGGENLVIADMNRTNLNAVHFPYMADPIILYQSENRNKIENGFFIAGTLCLSHDMISYRRIYLDYLPNTGDFLIFPNTAGYRMDFDETPVLEQRTAKKVCVVEKTNSFFWFEDEYYNPVRDF